MNIKIEDEVSPKLKKLMEEKPQITKSALKSTGYFTMKEIQKGIKSGSPGGIKYADFMPLNLKRRLNKVLGKRTSRLPLGKMSQAVKYKMDTNGTVTIGWLSNSAKKLGEQIEAGMVRKATDKVKFIFALAKIWIEKDKNEIQVPARHTFSPMYNKLKNVIPNKFEEKFIEKLNKIIK